MSNFPATQSKEVELTPLERLPNERLRAFVIEYCTGEVSGKKYNATQAATVAGYADPHIQASRIKRREDVTAAIDWLLKQVAMRPEEIVARLTDMAAADLGEIVDTPDHGAIQYNRAALRKYKHLIKSFKLDSNGNPVIEFHDPHAALKDLMRAYGMNKEGLELSGPGGGAIPVSLNVNFVAARRDENRSDENRLLSDENPD